MDTPRQTQSILLGFPSGIREEVAAVCRVLPPSKLAPHGEIAVVVDGESLRVPYRLYMNEPADGAVNLLDEGNQRPILHCIYTRHHNGFVRQSHLEQLLPLSQPWVVPYVIQLIGEYVIEILSMIQTDFRAMGPTDPRRAVYGRFVRDNSRYIELTGQRIMSYWNYAYRARYPKTRRLSPNSGDYPGFQLWRMLQSLAK